MSALDHVNDGRLIQALIDEAVRITPLKGYNIDLVEHHLNELLFTYHREGLIADYHSTRLLPSMLELEVMIRMDCSFVIDITVTKAPPQYAPMPDALATSLGF